MMAVALWSCGPVVMGSCGFVASLALVLASACPRASLGNALACIRHVLSRFRVTTHLVRCLVRIPDLKDFFAHRPCPSVSFDPETCGFVEFH